MAALATFGQLLRGIVHVTDMAIDFGVGTHQRKLVAAGVIVLNRMPSVVAVTIPALIAKAACMGVIAAMASIAVFWNFLFIVAALMTCKAIHVRMYSEQRVSRFLQVIELRAFPLFCGVTLTAIYTTGAAMLIVRCMAADACLRSRFVSPSNVARVACCAEMCAGQPELCLVVVELGARPTEGTVAFAAGLRELAVMHIVCFMTTGAAGCSLAPRVALLMAGATVKTHMGPLKCE